MEEHVLPAPADAHKEAQREFEDAVRKARDVGDSRRELSVRIQELGDEHREDVQSILEEGNKEIAHATQGFSTVRIAHDLPEGVGGQNLVGGGEASAVVNSALFDDPIELERTLIHEADPDVGHRSQAQPHVRSGQAALAWKGEAVSLTKALEGDVERGTAQKMDGSPSAHRPGQPHENYGEGQDVAKEIIALVGERSWNQHLKGDGDYATLQKKIWSEQLHHGGSVQEILREAEITGYQNEAREAVQTELAA